MATFRAPIPDFSTLNEAVDDVLCYLGDNSAHILAGDIADCWAGLATDVVTEDGEVDGSLVYFPGVALAGLTNPDIGDDSVGGTDCDDPEDAEDDYDETVHAQDLLHDIKSMLRESEAEDELPQDVVEKVIDLIEEYGYLG